MKTVTFRSQALFYVSSILFSIAFYIVLLIWCSFQYAVDSRKYSKLLQIIVHANFLFQIMGRIIIFICFFLNSNPSSIVVFSICTYITISLELITAIIFAYSGTLFYLKIKKCNNEAAKDALTRLCIISFASFVAIILACTDETLGLDFEWTYYARKVITRKIFKMVSITTDSWILLYMLGVRMPDENASSTVSFCVIFKTLWFKIRKQLLVRNRRSQLYLVTNPSLKNTAGRERANTKVLSCCASSVLRHSGINSGYQCVDLTIPLSP
ncbi:hypothetical protein BDF19DRAFT_120624 [Syncephalis fuscata]|nr:hypothetical protein BDF19DRAFT_120624 [Syncephalis fuscata]